MARRFPVYLLLDVSGSMSGEPVEAVRKGVEMVSENLVSSPVAVDIAYVSVITFGTEAREMIPLTRVVEFQPPEIHAEGLTAMGGALSLLANCIDRDIQRKKDENQRGDYRPLVFLLTDGAPTDDEPDCNGINQFEEGVRRIHDVTFANFIACGAGDNADMNKLNYIVNGLKENGTAVLLRDLSGNSISKFFQLVSDSILSSAGNPDVAISLDKEFLDLMK